MRTILLILFSGILLGMLVVTVTASLERGVFEAGADLWHDAWFRATLADAYFGFITFYVWLAYKERSLISRLTWFILVMGLGNIAMSVYVLIQLLRLPPTAPLEALLLRRNA